MAFLPTRTQATILEMAVNGASYFQITVQKWKHKPGTNSRFHNIQNSHLHFTILQIPKPSFPPCSHLSGRSCLSDFKLCQSGGQGNTGTILQHVSSALRQHHFTNVSCLLLALQIRIKRRFPKLFETCGLTFQPSDVLCPFQVQSYLNMNANTVDEECKNLHCIIVWIQLALHHLQSQHFFILFLFFKKKISV